MQTVKDAARSCALTERQLRTQITLGRIPTKTLAGAAVLEDDVVAALAKEPYVPAGRRVVVVKVVPAEEIDPTKDLLGRRWYGVCLDVSPGHPEMRAQQRAVWGAWPLRADRDDEVIGRLLVPSCRGWIPPHLAGRIRGIAEEVTDAEGQRRVLFDVQVPATDEIGGTWLKPRRGHLLDIGTTGPDGTIVLDSERPAATKPSPVRVRSES